MLIVWGSFKHILIHLHDWDHNKQKDPPFMNFLTPSMFIQDLRVTTKFDTSYNYLFAPFHI